MLLAAAYSIVNPLYEGTDELRHFRFVRVLAETGRLPVQGKEPLRSQSHHPPLYYAISAAATFWIPNQGEPYLTRPQNPFWGYHYWEVGTDNKNIYLHGADEAFPWYGVVLAAHLARLVNVALGLVTLLLTAAIMIAIFPGRPGLACGAAGLLAFNPMFLYMSGAINNDVAAAAAGAALTLACLLVLRDGLTRRRMAVLGGVFGLALLAKFNLLFFLPVIELVILYRVVLGAGEARLASGRARWVAGAFLRANLVFLGPVLILAGWWFVRNQIIYGDPTGFKEVTELWGMREPWESFGLAWSEIPNAWSSLWGRFGLGQIPLPAWVYQVLAWLTVAGGVGVLIGLIRGGRAGAACALLPQLLLLLLVVTSFSSVLFVYMLVSPAGSMGRFFFPGLPALAGLLFFGWAELARLLGRILRWPPRPDSLTLAWASNLGMVALAIWALVGFLAPAYAVPRPLDIGSVDQNLGLTLSDPDGPLVRLLGYEMAADVVRPGESLELTLYWQALRPAGQDYTIFVHLLDEEEIVVAQRDTYPGLGNYPSSHWQPGHVFAETYRLDLPSTAYAPAVLAPQVGIYSRDWGFRLDTGTLDNAVKLRSISLAPLPGDLPNPQRVNFDDQVTLVGYQMKPRVVRPGQSLLVQLYWQVSRRPDQNYGIFLHLLGAEDRKWASNDGRPADSMLQWSWHVPIEESRWLSIPEEMPPGTYQVEIGLWSLENDNRRLPIVAEDGHWLDDRLLLSPLRVLPLEAP